eukprot:2705541-Rhodomonas_salina.2
MPTWNRRGFLKRSREVRGNLDRATPQPQRHDATTATAENSKSVITGGHTGNDEHSSREGDI